MRHALDRRTVLVTAAAGLVAGCSDDDPTVAGENRRRPRKKKKSKQRNQAKPGQTRLAQDDLDGVAAELTALLGGEDRQGFLDYARPSDRAQWERMWDGLHAVPTVDRAFVLQAADDGWVNQKGGPVNATVRGVVAYRIDGCDGEPVAHLCDLTLFKPPKGAARVQALGPVRDETAAPWLLSPVEAVVGTSVVMIARTQDAATARRIVSQADAGAERAMDYLTAPPGVSRICITLSWPEARDRLYGGSDGDFVGSAHNYRYVDPQVLADTGERGRGETFDGSRVVIDTGAMSAQGPEKVSAHESVHALAFQWGRSAPPLYAEGLARFVELGAGETERAARDLGPARFGDFISRITARPGRAAFYDSTWLEDNYTAAAATCGYVAREYGDASLRDLVRAAYEGAANPARTVLGTSERKLLRAVKRWLKEQQ